MRRPAGIVFAAGVLAVLAAFGLLGTICGIVALFLLRPNVVPNLPVVRIALALFNAVAIAAFLWCLWTSVGLFRLKRWARYSMLVIGSLDFLVFSVMCAGILAARKNAIFLAVTAPRPGVPPSEINPGSILLIGAFFYAVLALVGVWWIVYFSLRHVRFAFSGDWSRITAESAVDARPAGDGLWRGLVFALACLLLLGAPMLMLMAAIRLPVFLGGTILSGRPATAVLLLLAAVQLLIGVGLLRRNIIAWWGALAWQIYSLATALLLLIPSYAARLLTYSNEASARFSLGVPQPPPTAQLLLMQQHILILCSVLGAVLVLIFIYALVRCRRYYSGVFARQSTY